MCHDAYVVMSHSEIESYNTVVNMLFATLSASTLSLCFFFSFNKTTPRTTCAMFQCLLDPPI